MWTQCTFRNEKNKEKYTQGWIDSKFAKIGKFVQLLTLGDDFWEITFTGTKTDVDPSLGYRTWHNNI